MASSNRVKRPPHPAPSRGTPSRTRAVRTPGATLSRKGRGRIASSKLLLDKLTAEGGAALANLVAGVHGEADQHGRKARTRGCGRGALSAV